VTVSWNNQYNPNELAQYIEKCRKVDSAGKVHFEGFQMMEHYVLLYSMLDFPDAVPEIEGRRIALHAVFEAGKHGAITSKNLLAEANRLTQEYLQRPPERYVLVTALSFRPSVSLRKIKVGDGIIVFESQLPIRYRKSRAQVTSKARHLSLFAEPPVDYLSTRVHVSARSFYEAADKASDILDLVRGIWNWFFNRRHAFRSSSGRRSPVNKVVLDPLHTIHHPTGKLATEEWWYQPEYCGPVKSYNPSGDEIDKMYAFLSDIRKRLARRNYREVIEQAIIRYGRALDMRDWETAFLKLWGVLELLTNTGPRDSNIVTVKRTASIYQDRDYALQVLKHLREYRNRSVHAGIGNTAIETYMWQLKSFVEDLLEIHLGSSYRFESLKEVAMFLNLPTDKAVLESRIRLMEYARKFRGV
jgi:hypothetical protein